MLEDLGLLSGWGPVTVGGLGWLLVAYVVRKIFKGDWVPGEEMRKWQDAYFEKDRQLNEALSTARVTNDLLRSLDQQVSQREGPPP